MKPAPLEYHAPDSLEEVLSLLAEHGDEGKIIAGGQSLVPMLSMRLARPAQLIDVTGVSSLAGVSLRGDVLSIGATTRERDVERSPLVAPNAPALAEALPLIGHMAIRNRGTVGGSIAHADASAELPAVAMATEATMVVRGPDGERTVAADDFFVGHYTTVLEAEECLLRIEVPTVTAAAGWAVQEVARRHGDFALVGVVAMVALAPDRTIEQARVCLFGVGERPVRAADVEAALVGAEPSVATFESAAADAVRDLEPGSDIHGSAAYRRHLAGVTVRRALVAATERARTAQGERVMTAEIELTVNGEVRAAAADARTTLADFLREELGLTGTHLGCEHGVCGACTVLVDGLAVRSCLMLAVQARGNEVTTIEGLADGDVFHPVQQGFYDCHAFQCGFCTPGFVMTTVELLTEDPTVDEAGIRDALSGNICRCTGYESIIEGVKLAASRMAGGEDVARPA